MAPAIIFALKLVFGRFIVPIIEVGCALLVIPRYNTIQNVSAHVEPNAASNGMQEKKDRIIQLKLSGLEFVSTRATAAVQANHVAHLQCQGCRTWLMYAHGARSVCCAICEAITRTAPDGPMPAAASAMQPLPHGGAGARVPPLAQISLGPSGNGASPGSHAGGAGTAAAASQPEMPAVVVQNPPSVDDQGNEVSSCSCLGPDSPA
jgi:LSD1 subclass zinc finger protein